VPTAVERSPALLGPPCQRDGLRQRRVSGPPPLPIAHCPLPADDAPILLCACRGPAQTPESLALSPQPPVRLSAGCCPALPGAARPPAPIHSSAIASVQPSAVLGDYLAFHPVVSIPCSMLYSCRRDKAQPSLPRRPVALAHLPPFRLTHVPQVPCNWSCSPAALQPSRPSPFALSPCSLISIFCLLALSRYPAAQSQPHPARLRTSVKFSHTESTDTLPHRDLCYAVSVPEQQRDYKPTSLLPSSSSPPLKRNNSKRT
jgi:hypothetical protein